MTEDKRTAWDLCDGAELEPLLRSGAIAILNAKWVVALWKSNGRIRRRQELPDEAFLSLDDLIGGGGPPSLLVASYRWLTPTHPDPKGTTLAMLGRVCQAYVNDIGATYGLFWEYVPALCT